MKLWTSKEADTKFSNDMREKHPYCANCGRKSNLTVSHYWGRTRSATRYCKDNCDVLCWMPCHVSWEKEKQGAYREFMVKKLGQDGYDKLQRKANSVVQRRDAIIDCMQQLDVI